LDSELDAAYRAALARSADQEAVRAAQRSWLKTTRNKCQDDEACLVAVYQQRIAALNSTRPDLAGGAKNNDATAEAKANVEAEEAADRNLEAERAAAESRAQAQKAADDAATAAAEQAEKLKMEAEKAAKAAEEALVAQRVAEAAAAEQRQWLLLAGGTVSLCILLAGIFLLRSLRRNRTAKQSSSLEKTPFATGNPTLTLEPFAIQPVDSGAATHETAVPVQPIGACIKNPKQFDEIREPATPDSAQTATTGNTPNGSETPQEPIKENAESRWRERVASFAVALFKAKTIILTYAKKFHGEAKGLGESICQLYKDIKESEGGMKSERGKELGKTFVENLSMVQRTILIAVSIAILVAIWPQRPTPFPITPLAETVYFGQSARKLGGQFHKIENEYKSLHVLDHLYIAEDPDKFFVFFDDNDRLVSVGMGFYRIDGKYEELVRLLDQGIGKQGTITVSDFSNETMEWKYKKNGLERTITVMFAKIGGGSATVSRSILIDKHGRRSQVLQSNVW
jgi:uncharacterized protein